MDKNKACKNCKYWSRKGATLLGDCELVVNYETEDIRYRILHDKISGSFPFLQSSHIYTGEDFCCKLHNVELKYDKD